SCSLLRLASVARRDLPPFPTRRSSDLSTIGIGRHAVHGGGRGGLYGRRIDIGRLFHNDLISHWLKSTLQNKCPQPCVSHMAAGRDRKSTRLNSSHVKISYAVFCLKKKN